EHVAVAHGHDLRLRERDHLAPQVAEGVPVDAERRGHEAARVHQVGGPDLVHVDGRAGQAREGAGGAGVVEVDVREEQMRDVARLQAQRRQAGEHLGHRDPGAALDQRPAAPRQVHDEDADSAGMAVVEGVDDGDAAAEVARPRVVGQRRPGASEPASGGGPGGLGVAGGPCPHGAPLLRPHSPAPAPASWTGAAASSSAATWFTSVPTPSTETSITSPTSSLPTPSGVPVRTRSPGLSVMKVEMYARTSATGKIMSLVRASCRTWPFTTVRRPTSVGSTSVSSHGPTGQKPSADLPLTRCRSERCLSRAVTSTAQV